MFGGGWLQTNVGMQDFAGSTAVHLVGATGALAALLVLGARRGKYGADGTPRPIPGHSMLSSASACSSCCSAGSASTPGPRWASTDGRFAEVAMVTMLGAAGGILGAYVATVVLQRTVDIGMVCNGLIAGLVAITAPSGYVENWAAPIIGLVGGLIVVPCILAIEKKVDDPVGVLSAHGIAGIWGTLACGLFTAPRFAQYNGIGNPDGGLVYSGSFSQLSYQALGVVVVFTLVLVALLDHVVRDRQDDRPAGERGGGDRRPRHLRARHVRLPGAVHPGRRAVRRHRGTGREAQRRPRAGQVGLDGSRARLS